MAGSVQQPSPARQSPFPDPIPGIIPFGSLVMLTGPAKRGKTAFATGLTTALRDGTPFLGHAVNKPTAVGIITTDHKWHLNQGQWFARAGFPDIKHYALRDDAGMHWRSMRVGKSSDDVFSRALDQIDLPPGSFLLIDVIGVFLTSKLNDYSEVLAGIGAVSQMLDKRQLTALGIGHMGKQKGDTKDQYKDPYERILGSTAQIGFTDTTFYLLGPKDLGGEYYEFGWLPTHSPEGTVKLQRNELGLFVPYDGMTDTTLVQPSPLDQVVDLVPFVLPGLHYLALVELIKTACGLKRTGAKERVTTLLEERRIIRTTEGLYIRPPLV